MKKLALLLLLFCILTGCGSRGTSDEALDVLSSTRTSSADATMPLYYDVEYLSEENFLKDGRQFLVEGDMLLCIGVGDGSLENCRSLFRTDFQGTEKHEIPLSLSEAEGIGGMATDLEGNIYLLLSTCVPDAHDEEIGVSMGYVDHHVQVLDPAGTVLLDFPLCAQDASISDIHVSSSGDIYIIRCEYDDSGSFATHYLDQYDAQGQLHGTVSAEACFPAGALFSGFIRAKNGDLFLSVQNRYGENQLYAASLVPEDYNTPLFTPTEEIYWPTFLQGTDADYYVYDSSAGFFAGNLGGTPSFLFSLDVLPATIPETAHMIADLGENRLLFRVYIENDPYFFLVTGQREPVSEPEKEVLVIGSYTEMVGGSLQSKIMRYNILHRDTTVEVRMYSTDENGNYLSPEEANENLQRDILNGDAPDILILDTTGFLPSTYSGNGFLIDLSPLMEQDEAFRSEDYYTNLWDTKDGSMDYLTICFSLRTMVTGSERTSDGWTPSEALSITEETGLPFMTNPEPLKYYILQDGLANYIDGNTCHFDDGEFAALLKLTQHCTNEGIETDLALKEKKVLAEMSYAYTLDYFLYLDDWYGDYAFKGVPSPDKEIMSAYVTGAVGVAETCEKKELAWDVVRMLLDSTQNSSSGLSVKRDEFQKDLDAAMLPLEDPESMLAHSGYTVGEVELQGTPLSENMRMYILQTLEQLNCKLVDRDIRQIAAEECEAFFCGEKSAEEVAALIQNRVSICLAERE